MWTLLEHKRVDKSLRAAPKEVLRRYEKWKDIVRLSGPNGLRLIAGLHDEALKGDWKGYRTSRLGIKYRVIYHVVHNQVLIKVVDVTPHDYRRK